MPKVSTNITLDAETKAKAQTMLADLGMDLSTAVNIFLKQMLYEGGIPFSITRTASGRSASETADKAPQRLRPSQESRGTDSGGAMTAEGSKTDWNSL